jgi:uncharacterized protein YndB with AHSA1/START domain
MNSFAAAAYMEPVSKLIRVNADPERAFEVFTAGMGRWWLPTHSINPTKSPIASVVIEPRNGGRWYERGNDGSECDWGRVLVWEPPTRLVLVWQINARWMFDPMLVTEVEIRFDATAAGATEVRLEHRNLERFGDAAANVRAAFDSEGGWGGLLEGYAKALA